MINQNNLQGKACEIGLQANVEAFAFNYEIRGVIQVSGNSNQQTILAYCICGYVNKYFP